MKLEEEPQYTRDTTLGELLDRGGGLQPGTTDALTLHFADENGEWTYSFAVIRGIGAQKVTDQVFTALVGGPIPRGTIYH